MASVVEPADKNGASPETAGIFAMLFHKKLAKLDPEFDLFKEAMKELGFRVTQEETHRWRFDAPVSLESKSMVVERPEGGKWEMSGALRLGRKLTRMFGWNKNTFLNRLDHTTTMIAQMGP